MDEQTLYIPVDVQMKEEFFPGFGKKELLQALIGWAIALGVAIALYFGTRNVLPAVVSFLIGACGSVMLTMKEPTVRISCIGQLSLLLRFWRSQKRYPYRHMKEWGE